MKKLLLGFLLFSGTTFADTYISKISERTALKVGLEISKHNRDTLKNQLKQCDNIYKTKGIITYIENNLLCKIGVSIPLMSDDDKSITKCENLSKSNVLSCLAGYTSSLAGLNNKEVFNVVCNASLKIEGLITYGKDNAFCKMGALVSRESINEFKNRIEPCKKTIPSSFSCLVRETFRGTVSIDELETNCDNIFPVKGLITYPDENLFCKMN